MFKRSFQFLALCALCWCARDALSEDPSSRKAKDEKLKAECAGSLYRSKKEGVVVYREPNTTAEVLRHLTLGEKVCYIGEQQGFAIIVPFEDLATKDKGPPAYIRLVDLWPPRDAPRPGSSGIIEGFKRQLDYMKYGGVRESGIGPADSETDRVKLKGADSGGPAIEAEQQSEAEQQFQKPKNTK